MEADKQFCLTVPDYERIDNVVMYNFRLEDTIKNKVYLSSFRFKDLQDYHARLERCKYDIPQFPKTHFWKKTNKHPKLIEQRRNQLQLFFNTIITDPLVRGRKEIKDFIRACRKQTARQQRCQSADRVSASHSSQRTLSLDKPKRADYFKQSQTINKSK